MGYYVLKQGMYWTYNDEGIYFYYNSNKLKTLINSSNNETFFELLKILKNPTSLEELRSMQLFENPIDLEETICFLEENKLIEILVSKNDIPISKKRIANFIGTFPQTSYIESIEKMERINTCLIGLGTAGSYVVDAYFKMGFSRLIMIDFDVVEKHNIVAQNFSEKDIGKSKMETLLKRYSEEFDSAIIEGQSAKIESFSHLKSLVDLCAVDYLLIYADDYDLTLELVEKVFLIHPNIKIILSGYCVLEVESILIDSENHESILEGLREDLKKFKSLKGVIVENSGTILESYQIAISTVKMILDNTLKINKTEYMSANFLNNSYYLGSQFEYLYNNQSPSYTKQILYGADEKLDNDGIPWINSIDISNIDNNNENLKPEIDSKMKNYLLFDYFDREVYDRVLNIKDNLNSLHVDKISNVEQTKMYILNKVLEFAKNNYSEIVFEPISTWIKYGYIYTSENKYGIQQPQAIKNEDHVFIYCTLDETLNSFNNLLHEIFHMIFYVSENADVYEHEEFVFSQQLRFFKYFGEDVLINKLMGAFVFNVVHSYLTSTISLQYEKYTILDNIKYFFEIWNDVEKEELAYILSESVNQFSALDNLKYYLAISKNMEEFMNIAYQSINKVEIGSVIY